MPIIYEYNTDSVNNLFSEESVYENREKMSRFSDKKFKSEVTIAVSMYKDLPKIKRCVDSIMKYTANIDFDLVFLIDGAQEGIFDYFKNFDYEKTTIIYNTANRGAGVPWTFINMNMISEYLALVAGDAIVTQNWLSNMLECLKSDARIGMVVPVSSNVSNKQFGYIGDFTSDHEMQEKAALYNISDSTKWEERLRLINIVQVFKKSAIYTLGIPLSDVGFAHNFGDDDMSFRIRRMGYKIILAGDTWIHHDHSRTDLPNKEIKALQANLDIGRNDFKNKYYGVDAWEDVNNYIFFEKDIRPTSAELPQILGIDVKCGTPILDIKNRIRHFGKYNAECYAVTENPKYFIDLQTICGHESVVCGDVIRSLDNFVSNSMDYIIIGKSVNTYDNAFEIITKCASVLKPDGHIFVYFRNTFDIGAYMNILGYVREYENEFAYNYSYDQFQKKILDMGGNIKTIYVEKYKESELSNIISIAEKLFSATVNKEYEPQESAERLMTKRWAFDITLG